MHKKKLALAALAAMLAGCATPPAPPAAQPTLDEYKRVVAKRITDASRDTYAEPVPEMLKSIVVLEITLDKAGAPLEVAVYRTNGYDELSARAIASVVDAAPFAPPASALLQGDGSVSFLETFLFREDDSFQLRSLVPAQ